jgi:hypothetical protein
LSLYLYPSAFLTRFFKIPFGSWYKATENELQGSEMAISKKIELGPRGHLFRNNGLPSDFNVEVEGVNVEVVKYYM